MNGPTSERGEEAVDGQNHPRGSVRVDSKKLEHSCENVGIYRSCPGTGAGVQICRRTESLALRDGSGEPPHFPAELKMVSTRRDPVGVPDGDDCQPQKERDQDNEKNRTSKGLLRWSPSNLDD